MALADVIVEVNALLTGVTAKLGMEHVGALDSPPRITWVPTTDTFAGARRTGSPMTGYAVRSVKTREVHVDVYLWAAGGGADADAHKHLRAIDALVNRVVWSIHQVAHGSYRLEGGTHQEAGHNTHGRGYVLRVVFDLPVTPAAADDGVVATPVTNIPREGSFSDAVLGQKDVTSPDPHDWELPVP